MTDFLKLRWTVKCVLYGNKITPLANCLPSLRSRVPSAHTAPQTPRKKMANAIILPLPTRRFMQDFFCFFATMKKETKKISGQNNICSEKQIDKYKNKENFKINEYDNQNNQKFL